MVLSPCCARNSQKSSLAPQCKVSILQHSAFFVVQQPHPYMTTGKAIAFNMLSRFVIDFLPVFLGFSCG